MACAWISDVRLELPQDLLTKRHARTKMGLVWGKTSCFRRSTPAQESPRANDRGLVSRSFHAMANSIKNPLDVYPIMFSQYLTPPQHHCRLPFGRC